MPRPVKWSRDLHSIRERANRSKTETWSRNDIQDLFSVGPSSAQSLMKAIGDVLTIGSSHFVDRSSLLGFLDQMIAAESVEAALQLRLGSAPPVPRPKPLRVQVPQELRWVLLADLPRNVELREGEIRVTGNNAIELLEGLALLAKAMENDFDNVLNRLEPPPPPPESADVDDGLREMLRSLRDRAP